MFLLSLSLTMFSIKDALTVVAPTPIKTAK